MSTTPHTVRLRRRLLAGVVATTPLVIAAGNATFPNGTFRFAGTRDQALTGLAATASAPGRVRAGSLILIVGLVLLGVSFGAIASIVRDRGGRTATAGAALGVVGSAAAILVVAWLGLSFYAASQAGISDEAKATYLVSLLKGTGLGNVAGFPFLGGLIGGGVLMGVALFRSHRVSRWLAIGFPVGVITGMVFAPQGPPALVMALPLVIVMPLLARVIDRTPEPSGQPGNEPVAATHAPSAS